MTILSSVSAAPMPTSTIALTPVPPPASRDDVDQLGDQIAALAARIHAATYELLILIHQFDAARGWHDGFASCARWLHWRTSIDLGAAREKVRVARALATLPRISQAMRQGRLSYSKVRAVTRIATPETEARLLDLALAGATDQVERVVRAWRRVDRVDAARKDERRHLDRGLTTWVDEDGMVVIRGRLAPEAGAVLLRALDVAADPPELAGPFDLAFIDALKFEYQAYLDAIIPRLAPGALVVADNVLWSGAVTDTASEATADTMALRAFSAAVLRDPRFAATILPVGDGLLLAGYRGDAA
jgi:hypothetical protein